ncbi:MAG: hypothetical protein CMJ58_14975 [Planctomycetaceae bacterium]|nr:hypothetical protein [Planctomycetaceae bacterium]
MIRQRLQFVSLYEPHHRRRDRVAMTALLAALAVLVGVGALLTARRLLAPQADATLSTMLLAVTALGAFAAVEGSRRVWRHLWPCAYTTRQRRMDQAVGWVGSLALLLVAFGCVYPGYYTAEWLIWLPLLFADQFLRQTFFERGVEPASDVQAPQPSLSVDEASPTGEVPALDYVVAAPADGDDALAGEVLQQLFRVRDEQGVEAVYGTVAADFVPGQRHAVLHVGFCPPLVRSPEIEAEPCAGPDARVKVLQCFTHGVRLEVRLAEPARKPCRVTVDLAAIPADAPRHASA